MSESPTRPWRRSRRVRHVLEYHGYHVVASFSDDVDDEELQFRIQEFMRYLEV